jgi:hypothetical protein
MSRKRLIDAIKRKADADIRIAPELAEIVIFACENAPPGSGMKTAAIEDHCAEASYERLRRLTKEFDLLNETSSGADRYLLNQRTNVRVYGADAMEIAVDDELRRVNRHVNKDSDVRQVVAETLGVSPNQVESTLFQGGLIQKRDRLENIVYAIQASPVVKQGSYGRIDWQSISNVYEATERAVRLYRR